MVLPLPLNDTEMAALMDLARPIGPGAAAAIPGSGRSRARLSGHTDVNASRPSSVEIMKRQSETMGDISELRMMRPLRRPIPGYITRTTTPAEKTEDLQESSKPKGRAANR